MVVAPSSCDNHPVKEAPTSPAPVVVLGIDDLRPLPRATRIARTGREGVRLLEEHRDSFIDELWLDHDLGGDDTIMPVVTLLEEAAFNGRPFQIGAVLVHSANPVGAATVVRSLARWSYRVRRATAWVLGVLTTGIADSDLDPTCGQGGRVSVSRSTGCSTAGVPGRDRPYRWECSAGSGSWSAAQLARMRKASSESLPGSVP
ncbi:hypothetical protein GCM10018790_64330 [Kitasatospora xanthocidica]|nr:hypothetical protein GCM10018790_64330 [Kitasatospora xanthocidica]